MALRPAIPLLVLVVVVGCAESPSVGAEPRAAAWVEIPAGSFLMGCTAGQSWCNDDEAEHAVTLTHAYLVGDTEVTQGQFEAALGYNPSHFQQCGSNCPVEQVSWHQAATFANALSGEEGLAECYSCTGEGPDAQCDGSVEPYACSGYRLLTEAEWEGAARCGEDFMFAGSDDLGEVAWYAGNSRDDTHAVARRTPNACGLYDMSGNVFEWTQDWYADVTSDDAVDPLGASSGVARVNKGGGWQSNGSYARVATRHQGGITAHSYSFGFRVGRTAD